MPERVLVAVSGGVDSAVSAHLLQSAGHEIIAVTMQLMPCAQEDDSRNNSCCSLKGIESARRICDHLGIQHTVVDLTEYFEKAVVSYFLDEYSHGRTPNPCVECNRLVKFARLRSHAAELGCTRISTGHYALVKKTDSGRNILKSGVDRAKDQSYFLWRLTQEQLGFTDFPVGDKTKEEVRRIAEDAGILEWVTPESQEICFVNQNTYHPFIKSHIGRDLIPGPIRDTSGAILGEHDGIELYTIGQRRGLGIAGGKPLYIVDIVPSENAVILGTRQEAMSTGLKACDTNWIAWNTPPDKFDALVKIRYLHSGIAANVTVHDNTVKVIFEQPQFAVAPGQSAVFYDGDTVLGGAVIDKRL